MIRTPTPDSTLAPLIFRRWQTIDGRWEALVSYVPYRGPKWGWAWVADPGAASERDYSPILWEAS